jgi:hypothetical protein
MELTLDEILKLIVPIIMIAISLMVRKNREKMEGKIIKWWVLLILGLILLIWRLVQLFYLSAE